MFQKDNIQNKDEKEKVLDIKDFYHRLKGKLDDTWVQSAMLHGSKLWAMNTDLQWLEINETRIFYWICNVSVHEQERTNEPQEKRLDI